VRLIKNPKGKYARRLYTVLSAWPPSQKGRLIKYVKEFTMAQNIVQNAFRVVEGRAVTSSFKVAEYFGKKHSDVVRDIRTLISQKPDLERNANFGECSETINLANGATRQVPFFWMDRKGFSLLAMGLSANERDS
jgi:Rha family phage regulatory protein